MTTTTSLADLLAAASTLDDPERSIAYEAKGGNRIVGRRDAYKVTADFDEDTKLYWLTEKNPETKGGGKVKKRLVTFLEEHGWHERPLPASSRYISR